MNVTIKCDCGNELEIENKLAAWVNVARIDINEEQKFKLMLICLKCGKNLYVNKED